VQDCAGQWGGSLVVDECGVCGGDGTSCIIPEVILGASISSDSSSILINYESNWPIAGFQFTVQGIGNLAVSGGDAELYGFEVSNTEYMVLGYSVIAETMPAGSDILIEMSGDLPESCNEGPPDYCIIQLDDLIIANIVFSTNTVTPFASCYEQNSNCIPSEYETILGCQNPGACNYNPASTADNGSCEYAEENYDCDGSCQAWIDCNGVCTGPGVQYDDPASPEVTQDCCASGVIDCAGVCDGDSWVSDCGCIAYLDGVIEGDWCDDCAGVPNGSSVADNCGICDADSSNDCLQDCAGIWGGTNWMSDCGCVAADNDGNECEDCAYIPNGEAELDGCDICSGGLSGHISQPSNSASPFGM
jgi:hypothetical protein